jgi:MYXO-CTERM domain-containing protein
MRTALAAIGLAALSLVAGPSQATVVYTPLAVPLTTQPNTGGGNNDGTGVWFNPLTGYAEARGFQFPATLYEDGKFFLLLDTVSYSQPEAQIFTQGFFSRGNGVIYESSTNLNAAWFEPGTAIGPATGYQNPGAGFPDIGPVFGNGSPGRAFLGLTIRDPAGLSSSDIFYAYADITLGNDYVMTLNAFAYENVRGAPITTAFAAPVPEPATTWTLALGLAGLAAAWQRRRR